MKFDTLAVHAGYAPDPTTKSVAVPIYQTTSYATAHGAGRAMINLRAARHTSRANGPCGIPHKCP